MRLILLLLLLTTSCQSKKLISKSTTEKQETTETQIQQTQSTTTNQRITLDAIDQEHLDLGTLIAFDGPGQITISPTGQITATGTNPTVHHYDQSTRTSRNTQTQESTTTDTTTTTTTQKTQTQETTQQTEKDIERQFKFPWYIYLILAAAILLTLYNLIPTPTRQ